MILHPGYGFEGCDYSTKRGIAEYNKVHRTDFVDFIRKHKLTSGTVVDLGCGNGVFLEQLSSMFPNLTVIGVDKKAYEHKIPSFVQADLRFVPLKDGIADLLVSTAVEPWIKDNVGQFHSEIMRLIAPNGYGFVLPAWHLNSHKEEMTERGKLRYFEGPIRDIPQLVVSPQAT